jgi:AraC family transcriptional regulator
LPHQICLSIIAYSGRSAHFAGNNRKISRVKSSAVLYDEDAAVNSGKLEVNHPLVNPEHVLSVQRMQQYIASHINQPITLQDLARTAGYSPWHSARLFKDLTGKAPYDYIRALRLSKAALRLSIDAARVIDVALDFVFSTPDGFSRAFTSTFGLPPSEYRQKRPPIRLFLPVLVQHRNELKGEMNMSDKVKPVPVFVQVIERPARRLILRRGIKAAGYFEYCQEVGCEIWDILSNVQDALYEPAGLWLPPNLVRPGTSVYAQGVEMPADYAGPVPADCELIDLPPCKMMVFQGPPFDDDKFEEAISDIWDIMQNYQPETYGFRWADEDGPRFQLIPMGYRGYIEARPVRMVNG